MLNFHSDAYFWMSRLAAETYKDFESLHPRHEAIPYVLYQTGMSLMKQFRSIDRATTELQEAYDYFNRLSQMYPDSPYAKGAEEHMHTCRKLMAEHELYIADVFLALRKYGPAARYECQKLKDAEVANTPRKKNLALNTTTARNRLQRRAKSVRVLGGSGSPGCSGVLEQFPYVNCSASKSQNPCHEMRVGGLCSP